MELERKENPELEIINEGMEPEELVGPELMCCWGPFSPTLW